VSGDSIAVDPQVRRGHYFENRGHPIVECVGLELQRALGSESLRPLGSMCYQAALKRDASASR
jgi:hypothetical protein